MSVPVRIHNSRYVSNYRKEKTTMRVMLTNQICLLGFRSTNHSSERYDVMWRKFGNRCPSVPDRKHRSFRSPYLSLCARRYVLYFCLECGLTEACRSCAIVSPSASVGSKRFPRHFTSKVQNAPKGFVHTTQARLSRIIIAAIVHFSTGARKVGESRAR